MRKQRIAIFASGSGSNAEAIIDYLSDSDRIEVACVITNNPEAGVIERADRLGVDYLIIPKSGWKDEELVLATLSGYEVDFLILAGWLQLIPAFLVRAFQGCILNIHPALLPKFGGKGMYGHYVHEAVKKAAEQESGITIHLVNEQYDDGAIIFQKAVPLDPEDESSDIEQKVRALELKHYPEEIKKFVLSNSKTSNYSTK